MAVRNDESMETDPYQGFPTIELIRDDEDSELSVLTCKAITQSPRPKDIVLPATFEMQSHMQFGG